TETSRHPGQLHRSSDTPGEVGDAVETGAERLRDHLRRPYRPQQRKLAITEAGSTVHLTLPLDLLVAT
ncbi:hypothetical protein ACFQ34_18185, partial [Pseudonocardia benzenivorans]